MGAERVLRHQLIRNSQRKVVVDATCDVDLGQFLPLERGVLAKLLALARQIGPFGIGLRADRNILAGRHRHRAGHQAGHAGDQNLARPAPAAATPTIRLAVETMPSLAPSTAARSQPMRSTLWFSPCTRSLLMMSSR